LESLGLVVSKSTISHQTALFTMLNIRESCGCWKSLPYPFVICQARLPLVNRDRNGKPKKSKRQPQMERNNRREEEIQFNTGTRKLRGIPEVDCRSCRLFRMLRRTMAGVVVTPVPVSRIIDCHHSKRRWQLPPLSTCSSTTTLVSLSMVLISEYIGLKD